MDPPKFSKMQLREDAVLLGQKMMDEGIFCHVKGDRNFENKKTLYQFNNPEAVAQQKKERQAFLKADWLEKKGTFSWTFYWMELRGNIVNYYDKPNGNFKGSFNILGSKIGNADSPKSFQLAWRFTSCTLRAESETARNSWVTVICRAKDKTLEERDKLLEIWKKEDACISCIAALATEQAAQEEEEGKDALSSSTILETPVEGSEEKKEGDDKMKILNQLYNLPLANVDEQPIILKDIFKKEIIVLALLRHFG